MTLAEPMPSGNCSSVRYNDKILFCMISTATYIFRYSLLTFHLCTMHSPMLETFIPVESTAITKSNRHYFITNTGQCAYVTTPLATLPSNIFLKPVLPLVPTTIRSTLFLSE